MGAVKLHTINNMNPDTLEELRSLLDLYQGCVYEKMKPLIKPGNGVVDAAHLVKIRVRMSSLVDSRTYSIATVMETVRLINELIGYLNTAEHTEAGKFLEKVVRVITALKTRNHVV
jgi:hypothetical protein